MTHSSRLLNVKNREPPLQTCDDAASWVDPNQNSRFYRHVLAFQPHMYEVPITGWWFLVCIIGGLFLLVWGGRAIGFALLGAVVGAIIGAFVYADRGPEGFASSLPVGASIGLVVGGLVGLLLPESRSISLLRRMGIAVALLGSISMLAIHLGASIMTCSLPGRIPMMIHCLPSWGFTAQSLYAFDVLFLVALCFASAERVRRKQRLRTEPPPPPDIALSTRSST